MGLKISLGATLSHLSVSSHLLSVNIVWFYEPQFICAEKLKGQGELSLRVYTILELYGLSNLRIRSFIV